MELCRRAERAGHHWCVALPYFALTVTDLQCQRVAHVAALCGCCACTTAHACKIVHWCTRVVRKQRAMFIHKHLYTRKSRRYAGRSTLLRICSVAGGPAPTPPPPPPAAVGPELNSRNWIATADSQEPGINPPQAVLDASSAMTFWHTKWQGGYDPLPHQITLYLAGNTYSLNGLRYEPRQDGSANGRCGAYKVPLSSLLLAVQVTHDNVTHSNELYLSRRHIHFCIATSWYRTQSGSQAAAALLRTC